MAHRLHLVPVVLALLALPAIAQPGPSTTLPADAPKTGSKTFIDYFLPAPTHGTLTRDVWGTSNVLPRDPKNGLEDTTMKQYCYLAAIDVEKEQNKGNDNHGSKVIVIPFDGTALDRDLQTAANASKP